MDTKIFDGTTYASIFRNSLKEFISYTRNRKYYVRPPKLAIIQVVGNKSSDVYVRNKIKVCENVGILTEHFVITNDDIQLYKNDYMMLAEHVIHFIVKANFDDSIDGIILQLPIEWAKLYPNEYKEKGKDYFNELTEIIINKINPEKDVDGLTVLNAGMLSQDRELSINAYISHFTKYFIPATPKGIYEILKSNNEGFCPCVSLNDKKIAIIGRSNLLGKPLFHLLSNKSTGNAQVTLLHTGCSEKNINDTIKESDIVICCAGNPDKYLVNADNIKEGAIVIDAAINVKEIKDKDGNIKRKLYGDADFDNIKDKCSFITPVPGGIGPMTITMLLQNVVDAWQNNIIINK